MSTDIQDHNKLNLKSQDQYLHAIRILKNNPELAPEFVIPVVQKSLQDMVGKSTLLFPDAQWMQWKDVIMVILILMQALKMTFELGFSQNIFLNEETTKLNGFQLFVYFYYLIFCLLITNTAIYDFYLDELNTNRTKIIKMYLKSSHALIDLIVLFPFGAIFKVADINLILMVVRLKSTIISIIQVYKMKKNRRINDITTKIFNLISTLTKQKKKLKITGVMFTFLFFNHLGACIYNFLQKLEYHQQEKNNITKQAQHLSVTLDSYITQFYFILQTTVTTGYGDIPPTNQFNRVVVIIWMFCGCLLQQYFIGSLSTILQDNDKKEQEYLKSIEVLESMQEKYNINYRLIKQVKHHVKYQLQQSTVIMNDKEFLNLIPQTYRIILILEMNRHFINKINIFQNVSAKVITQLLQVMSPRKYDNKEIIFAKGDEANYVYFIIVGKVIGQFVHDYRDINFMVLNEGMMFGDVDIFCHQEKRTYNVISQGESEFMVVSKEDYSKILSQDTGQSTKRLIQHTIKKKEILEHMQEKAKKKGQKQIDIMANLNRWEFKNNGSNKKQGKFRVMFKKLVSLQQQKNDEQVLGTQRIIDNIDESKQEEQENDYEINNQQNQMSDDQIFSEIQLLEDQKAQLTQKYNKIQLQLSNMCNNTVQLNDRVLSMKQFLDRQYE